MNTVLTLTAAGTATTAAGLAVAAVAPTDWSGLAQFVGAIGGLIVAVATVLTNSKQGKQGKDIDDFKKAVAEAIAEGKEENKKGIGEVVSAVGETKTAILETKVIATEAKDAVNGGVTRLLKEKDDATAAKVELATVEGAAEERAKATEKKGIEDAAILKEQARAAAAAPAPAAATAPATGLPVPVEVVNPEGAVLKTQDVSDTAKETK